MINDNINEKEKTLPLSMKEIIEIKRIFIDFLNRLKGKIEDNINNYEQKDQYREVLSFFDRFFNERISYYNIERIFLTKFCFEFREKWPNLNILTALWFKINIYFDNETLRNCKEKIIKSNESILSEFEHNQDFSQVKNGARNNQIESCIFGYPIENFYEHFDYSLRDELLSRDLEKENNDLKSKINYLEEQLKVKLISNKKTTEARGNQLNNRAENNLLVLEVDSLRGLIHELNRKIDELETQLAKYKELFSQDKSKKMRNNFKNLQKAFWKIEVECDDKYKDQCKFLEGFLKELIKRQEKSDDENKKLESEIIMLNEKLENFKIKDVHNLELNQSFPVT
ncbi:MAG: hypothetical protein AM1032_000368 [Mycoplasmataceae bacterium]|nr:MAG: hypothetical protein AM1032_000368 [Mycoplasmataceae bacterium]